jgi:hypothetical protein
MKQEGGTEQKGDLGGGQSATERLGLVNTLGGTPSQMPPLLGGRVRGDLVHDARVCFPCHDAVFPTPSGSGFRIPREVQDQPGVGVAG